MHVPSFRLCTIDHPHKDCCCHHDTVTSSHRRAHHMMKSAAIGKGIVTAALYESTSAPWWVNSPTRCLTPRSSEPTTDTTKTSITIKRIICRRWISLPHSVTKDKRERNWDECRSRSWCVEEVPLIVHLTLLLFILHPFLFYHLCLAPQLLSNLK